MTVLLAPLITLLLIGLKNDQVLIHTIVLAVTTVIALRLWRTYDLLMPIDVSLTLLLCAACQLPLTPFVAANLFAFGLFKVVRTLSTRKVKFQLHHLLMLALVLVVWDIFVVAKIYPHMSPDFLNSLSVATVMFNADEIVFVPTFGAGDFLVMGFLSLLVDVPTPLTALFAAVSFIVTFFVPVECDIFPALTVLLPTFFLQIAVYKGVQAWKSERSG